MKSTEQQKIIISEYKAKSQKIQYQLWSTVPGICKKYYYKTKQRTTRVQEEHKLLQRQVQIQEGEIRIPEDLLLE